MKIFESKVYEDILKEIGFEDLGHVLDAGCGDGHWARALYNIGNDVIGIDTNFDSIVKAKEHSEYDMPNLRGTYFYQCNMEDEFDIRRFMWPHKTLDGIFAYSSIFLSNDWILSDWIRKLRIFYGLLKPGGLLYFTTDGLGWYLDNILHRRWHRFSFTAEVMSPKKTIKKMELIGFEDIEILKDPLYDLKWHGLDNVFAVRARK